MARVENIRIALDVLVLRLFPIMNSGLDGLSLKVPF